MPSVFRSSAKTLAVLAALALSGCSDDSQPAPEPEPDGPLVEQALWRLATDGETPYVQLQCPPQAVVVEPFSDGEQVFDVLELDTDFCDPITIAQPAGRRVAAGDTVTLTWFHFPLWSPEPSTATVTMGVEQTILFEATVDVPGGEENGEKRLTEPGGGEESIVANEGIAPGQIVWFHVENHGENTYLLVDLLAD